MSGDLTPGEIQDGAASDGSFVHATQASDGLSHRHNETNISRLRSAINNFDSGKMYQIGDIVKHFNIHWRAITNNISGAFNISEWETIGPVLEDYDATRDYPEGHLILGNASKGGADGVQLRANMSITGGVIATLTSPTGNVTLYQNDEAVTLDGTTGTGATGTAVVSGGNLISVTLTNGGSEYQVSEAILVIGTISGANTASVTPATLVGFLNTDWDIADGVGVRDVKQIFSEDDFPPQQTIKIGASNQTVHILEDGKSYLISDDITLVHALFIETNTNAIIFEIGSPHKKITADDFGSPFVIRTRPEFGPVSITDSSGVALFDTSPNAHDLVGGVSELVNVSAPFYNLVGETVDTVPSSTTFTLTGILYSADSVGDWDRGASNVTLENLNLVKTGSGSVAGFDLVLRKSGEQTKSFIIKNLMIKEFNAGIGNLVNGTDVLLETLMLESNVGPITINNPLVLQLHDVFGATNASNAFEFRGDDIQFINIENIPMDIHSLFHMFNFPTTGTDPVDSDVEVHVHDCKDLNTVNDGLLFQTGANNLDQTSTNFFVHDNGKQPDSLYYANGFISGNVNLVVGMSPLPPTGDLFTGNIDSERFTIDTNGIVTYTGTEDVKVLAQYNVTLTSLEVSDTVIFKTIFVEDVVGGGATNTDIDESESQMELLFGVTGNLSGMFLRTLSNGDNFQVRFFSDDASGGFDLIQLNVSVRSLK